MSEEQLIPKLRFSGFNEDWEIKKLNDLSKIQRGASPRPISSKKWYDTENKNVGWVRIGDVTASSKYLTETEDYFSEEGIKKSRFLPKGSLIMSICATIGKPIITDIDTCIHDGFVGFSELNVNKEFLYYYLNILEPKFYSLSQTGSQANLNSDLVRISKIGVPSIKEQEKIVNFLSLIDNKIGLLEKKYQSYVVFKKYFMQQIFAQKLRFDFDDEWKQYKLKDLLTVKSSSISINQLEDNTGEYPLYGASGFLKNIDFCEMETDYISIVKDGSGVGNLSYHEKNSSIVNTSQYLLPKKDFDIHFLYYQLQTLNLLKYVNGSSIPHIYFKDYCIEKVTVPSLPEQQKIGKLFVDTDKTIENIDNCIRVTQEFKKGLLQQMFV